MAQEIKKSINEFDEVLLNKVIAKICKINEESEDRSSLEGEFEDVFDIDGKAIDVTYDLDIYECEGAYQDLAGEHFYTYYTGDCGKSNIKHIGYYVDDEDAYYSYDA